VELTEAERGFLLLKERDTGKLLQRVGRTSDKNDINEQEARISTVATRVFKDNKAVFATDTSAQDDLATRRSVHELRLKMMVCVPLATESEVLGVIYADGRTSLDKVFTNTNRRTFEMLAEHAAAAIENARMFERATNDPLTGLPNSSYFLLQLAKVLREATTDAPAGVLLLDIDAFKRVNLAAGAEVIAPSSTSAPPCRTCCAPTASWPATARTSSPSCCPRTTARPWPCACAMSRSARAPPSPQRRTTASA